jgi:hypothetical protein
MAGVGESVRAYGPLLTFLGKTSDINTLWSAMNVRQYVSQMRERDAVKEYLGRDIQTRVGTWHQVFLAIWSAT